MRKFFLNDNTRAFMLLLLIALFALSISSCSCDYHASRIAKRCGASQIDTITHRDSIFINKIEKDTVFKFGLKRDTVVLKQNKLTVKYFYNTHDSTIYIQGKCDSIIIYRDVKIPVEKIIVEENWFSKNKWLILFFLSFFVALYFTFNFRKF